MKKSVRTFTLEALQSIYATIAKYKKLEKPMPKILAGGQHKVGDIPRWSLPPLETCTNCKDCSKHCYACKDYLNYRVTAVAKNHTRNLLAVIKDLASVEEYLVRWIAKHEPRFFRIHPSGDFAVRELKEFNAYAYMWYRVAKRCPKTRFLAFTKAYDIVRSVPFHELDNFSLVLSEWTDVLKAPDDLKQYYRTSRAVENIEDARPNEIICPGNCETCGMCWALKDLDHDVAFEIH